MIKIMKESKCRYCKGSGEQTCHICGGSGYRMIYKNPLPNVFAFVTYDFSEISSCYKCHTVGTVICRHCKGTGKSNSLILRQK